MITPHVLALLPNDSWGCLLWRNWWPSDELRKHGFIADYLPFEKYKEIIEPALLSGKYNLVVTPRFVWTERWMQKRFIYTLDKGNLAWAYEIDDDMISDEIVNRQVAMAVTSASGKETLSLDEIAAMVRAKMEYERSERELMLALVDGTTVSTEPLAQIIGNYSPVHIVPNAMDIPWFTNHMLFLPRILPPLTIGWSGGWRYISDLEQLVPAWVNIARRFPDISFVLHGWIPPNILTAMPANRVRILPWSDVKNYPAVIKNIDIACCSVSNSEWNANKSSIKWYEMSMAGAAVVASHAVYGREITHEYDGLLATTSEEWEDHLTRLIMDTTLRQMLIRNAQHTIKQQHNIANSWPQWISAWSTILEQFVISPRRSKVLV